MRAFLSAGIILAAGQILIGQAHHPAKPAHSYSSAIGFRYSVPGDWDVGNAKPDADAKAQAASDADSETDKKGIACAQMGMTARHGGSVIVDVALPFDCFGQQLSEDALQDFGDSASQGLKQSFDIGDPTYGSYRLGTHKLWIERVKGTPKGQVGATYTIEVACAVLKKGAVCWMAMAADDAALQTFEHAKVSLDGEAPVGLVSPTAFQPKP
jgi:hypothetical protein